MVELPQLMIHYHSRLCELHDLHQAMRPYCSIYSEARSPTARAQHCFCNQGLFILVANIIQPSTTPLKCRQLLRASHK